MFVLEKIILNSGQSSMVGVGHSERSPNLMVFLHGEHEAEQIENVQDIRLGWQVLVERGSNFLQTSPVQEILETREDYIRFKTRTSIYELYKINN